LENATDFVVELRADDACFMRPKEVFGARKALQDEQSIEKRDSDRNRRGAMVETYTIEKVTRNVWRLMSHRVWNPESPPL
jgi:hypothetical protein